MPKVMRKPANHGPRHFFLRDARGTMMTMMKQVVSDAHAMTAAAARPRPRPAAAQLEGHVHATADDAAAFRLPATMVEWRPWYDRMAVNTCKNDTFCSQRKATAG